MIIWKDLIYILFLHLFFFNNLVVALNHIVQKNLFDTWSGGPKWSLFYVLEKIIL